MIKDNLDMLETLKISWDKTGPSRLKEIRYQNLYIDLEDIECTPFNNHVFLSYNTYSPPTVFLASRYKEAYLTDIVNIPFLEYAHPIVPTTFHFEVFIHCMILFYKCNLPISYLMNSKFVVTDKATIQNRQMYAIKTHWTEYLARKTSYTIEVWHNKFFASPSMLPRFSTSVYFGILDIKQ